MTATYERLRAKPPIERSLGIDLDGDGEKVVTIRFRSIGSKAYGALVDAHQNGKPPGLPFNAETFAPALVAASSVEPDLSAEQVAELFDEWNSGDLLALFTTAMDANTASNVRLET